MRLLGLSRRNGRVSVNGMSGTYIGVARGICSCYNSSSSLKLKLSVEFSKAHDHKIDLFISWDSFMSIFREGEVVDSSGEIIAKNTKFG